MLFIVSNCVLFFISPYLIFEEGDNDKSNVEHIEVEEEEEAINPFITKTLPAPEDENLCYQNTSSYDYSMVSTLTHKQVNTSIQKSEPKINNSTCHPECNRGKNSGWSVF